MVHIHPLWAGALLDDAVPFVSRIYDEISALHPDKQIVIGETGWATSVHTEGQQADLINGITGINEQIIFYNSINEWTKEKGALVFYFEAFDEKWKDANNTLGSENHFGLINLQGEAKYAIWNLVDSGIFKELTRDEKSITKTFGGDIAALMETVLVPPTNEEIMADK